MHWAQHVLMSSRWIVFAFFTVFIGVVVLHAVQPDDVEVGPNLRRRNYTKYHKQRRQRLG